MITDIIPIPHEPTAKAAAHLRELIAPAASELDVAEEVTTPALTPLGAEELLSVALSELQLDSATIDTSLASGLAAWLRSIRFELKAAEAEYERIKRYRDQHRSIYDALKGRVLNLMQRTGQRLLSGPTWRLQICANGGRQALEVVDAAAVPPFCWQPFSVPATALVALFDQLWPSHANASTEWKLNYMLGLLDINPDPATFKLDSKAVWDSMIDNTPPSGIAIKPRGCHLRVD